MHTWQRRIAAALPAVVLMGGTLLTPASAKVTAGDFPSKDVVRSVLDMKGKITRIGYRPSHRTTDCQGKPSFPKPAGAAPTDALRGSGKKTTWSSAKGMRYWSQSAKPQLSGTSIVFEYAKAKKAKRAHQRVKAAVQEYRRWQVAEGCHRYVVQKRTYLGKADGLGGPAFTYRQLEGDLGTSAARTQVVRIKNRIVMGHVYRFYDPADEPSRFRYPSDAKTRAFTKKAVRAAT